jgi:hypothetical protein
MLAVRVSLAFLLLSATSTTSMGIWVRNANGEWVRPSWEKRANPGDVLSLPLKNNGDKSYTVSGGHYFMTRRLIFPFRRRF